MKEKKQIIVIGGGPSGLTAAYTFCKKNVPVVCYEADSLVGGISRTVNYKGYRFDIGGHRFFTKIPEVNALWEEILGDDFLLRPRLSRIYYNKTFFDYPLKAKNSLFGLGLLNSFLIGMSYIKSSLFPVKPEETFEQWVSNRFGARLYKIFFKTYTEKVWGIPCTEIRAEWAAQRIQGLSLLSAVLSALFKPKKVIKSLIEEFRYPRLGPGQMYEAMAERITDIGGNVALEHRVTKVYHDKKRIISVLVESSKGKGEHKGTDFISTMPITQLILSLRPKPPEEVITAAKSLRYRALLTVNLLLDQPQLLPDTWIYIHDASVKMGRIQFFANWSPDMVPDKQHSSVGLEYFCWEGDELWTMENDDLLALGIAELDNLGLVPKNKVLDGFVIRMPKCYPVYDKNYKKNIAIIRSYLTGFANLQLCGRYGLFKYNNMDHSILTALYAVENVFGAEHDVWSVNADDEYHEKR